MIKGVSLSERWGFIFGLGWAFTLMSLATLSCSNSCSGLSLDGCFLYSGLIGSFDAGLLTFGNCL